ncbi:uncharacterized protein [Acropora muricata]|uniref:uncharacterized protein isoform X3 n=1 Tax=Acropora muricata TaxID=159855 RepID=UPI0034E5146B
MKEKAYWSCRKRTCGQDFAVDFAHFFVRTEREDRNLRPPKSRDYLLFRYLNSLLQTFLFSPEFRSIIAVSRYKVDSRLLFSLRILLKRKGDKSVQEYETDAGIQKWTEQRLTKSSAQEARCFSTIS